MTPPSFNENYGRDALVGAHLVPSKSNRAWIKVRQFVEARRAEIEGARDLNSAHEILSEFDGGGPKALAAVLAICASKRVRVARFGVLMTDANTVKIDVDQKGET